jgi:hypothetical protein
LVDFVHGEGGVDLLFGLFDGGEEAILLLREFLYFGFEGLPLVFEFEVFEHEFFLEGAGFLLDFADVVFESALPLLDHHHLHVVAVAHLHFVTDDVIFQLLPPFLQEVLAQFPDSPAQLVLPANCDDVEEVGQFDALLDAGR